MSENPLHISVSAGWAGLLFCGFFGFWVWAFFWVFEWFFWVWVGWVFGSGFVRFWVGFWAFSRAFLGGFGVGWCSGLFFAYF